MECKVKSLYKALNLLTYFDEEHKEVGVTELAEFSGMHKSSVHNILQTFELCGYVVQNIETRKYMLGGEILSLFARYKSTRSIDYRVIDNLRKISTLFGGSVYLVEKNNEETVFLCAEQSGYDKDDILAKEGMKLPMHCTSAGKVLLAFSSVEEKKKICSRTLNKYTEHTITDEQELLKVLEKIIYDGYAVGEEEYRSGHYCVAVPIIVGAEKVNYSIMLSKRQKISTYMLKRYLSELNYISREIGSILYEGSKK